VTLSVVDGWRNGSAAPEAREEHMRSIYVCPETRKSLQEGPEGLVRDDGVCYPFIRGCNDIEIPNFLGACKQGDGARQTLATYDQESSAEIYRNFLDWLFQTFDESESAFRANLVARLKLQKGNRVLITGCGLGADIPPVTGVVGPEGEVFAIDLAAEMVVAASYEVVRAQPTLRNRFFAVCDAQALPFSDNFFDGAFHFGGINLFDDVALAISEMERVVKPGARVVFGDEGVAPWLRNTEYGRMAINNNPLWAASAPIDVLPGNAVDVQLSWALGNCFYVIDFQVSDTGPHMNIDVPHKGLRGGSMRTRYFGQLEGVTEESKAFVLEDAKRKRISVHDWLEHAIASQKKP
jgi:SAM-dependent methyltransferase